jgi:membrane-bound inhibitor of C-type lysozyme
MKTNTSKIIFFIIALIIILAVMHVSFSSSKDKTPQTTALSLIATASYACDSGKTITAEFYDGPASVSTTTSSAASSTSDQPPVPTGSVALKLSDGRSMTLHQTISADGTRYSNGNPTVSGSESFVFWSKGKGALILENNEQKSFIGCISVVPDSGGLSQVYQNGTDGFSLRYPTGYVVDASYQYQELGPGKTINGIKFTIPESIATGTNLASDSYVSVEEIQQTQAQSCTADLFLDHAPALVSVDDGDMTYSVASTTGAGAGNRYEETVYALPYTNPCIAVRYFIHYGVLENYPPGAVAQFSEQALHSQFDQIRRSLTIVQ